MWEEGSNGFYSARQASGCLAHQDGNMGAALMPIWTSLSRTALRRLEASSSGLAYPFVSFVPLHRT